MMTTTVVKSTFGMLPDGKEVALYTFESASGFQFSVSALGAAIVSVFCPSRKSATSDIVLGFDDLSGYLNQTPYLGVTVGRVANRIANGRFTLDGNEIVLAQNNGKNHLHGGVIGFDKKLWSSKANEAEGCVTFTYRSEDGEEGYPGQLDCTVKFSLAKGNGIRIQYSATTTKATPINLSNHSYFNLGGQASGSVLDDHVVEILASRYTPVDDTAIPTGEIANVEGSPFDFRKPASIGSRIESTPDRRGYDHNYVLSVPKDAMHGTLQLISSVFHSGTERKMEVFSTQPGMQLYTGNFLDGSVIGKGKHAYQRHEGFCMETQNFPDAVNQEAFPSCVLRPSQTYCHETVYQFSW
ncbi:galactose mutarotase-like [Oscarella lobularis]|uniref:galactose mutarotase-like n=1 Tax=Oscarella lobularis TaxID=121494 RepID=UPI003313EE68